MRYRCMKLADGTMLLHKHPAQISRRPRKQAQHDTQQTRTIQTPRLSPRLSPRSPSLHNAASLMSGSLPLEASGTSRSWRSVSRFNAGYSSATSSASSIGSTYNVATGCKQKRMPTLPGGHPCSFPGCSKVFDRDGERRHLQRYHQDKESLPYGCETCDKRFVHAKDLKRHEKTHQSHAATSEDV